VSLALSFLVSIGSVILMLIGFGCGGSGTTGAYSLNGGSTTTYSVSGNVATSDGTPLTDVSVALTGSAKATTATDANGNYNFSGLGTGSYTVTPTLLDYLFSPDSISFSISSSDSINSSGLNFIATSPSTSTDLIHAYMTSLQSQVITNFLADEQAIASSCTASGTLGTGGHYNNSKINYENKIQSFLDSSLAYIQSISRAKPIDMNAIIQLLNTQKDNDKAFSINYYNQVNWLVSSSTISTCTTDITTDLDNMYSLIIAQVQTL
jgi:Carboxypeptidase regulatory-like domain